MSVAMQVPRTGLPDRHGCYHVVLVDDQLDLADPLIRALAVRDVVIHVVADCFSGLGKIAVTHTDVVVAASTTDQVADFVRVVHDEIGLPVLLALDSPLDESQVAAVMAGAQPVVGLPYEPDALAAAIRRTSHHRPALAPLVAGALQLDRLAFSARLGDRDLALSAREFNVLHELAEHPDQVVPRSALRQFVRGQQTSDLDRSVWAAATRLRLKLAAAGAPQAIRTIRGVGFALDSRRL